MNKKSLRNKLIVGICLSLVAIVVASNSLRNTNQILNISITNVAIKKVESQGNLLTYNTVDNFSEEILSMESKVLIDGLSVEIEGVTYTLPFSINDMLDNDFVLDLYTNEEVDISKNYIQPGEDFQTMLTPKKYPKYSGISIFMLNETNEPILIKDALIYNISVSPSTKVEVEFVNGLNIKTTPEQLKELLGAPEYIDKPYYTTLNYELNEGGELDVGLVEENNRAVVVDISLSAF